MAAAMRGIDVPHWVAVHGVDDVAPGLYRWPDLSIAAAERRPARRAASGSAWTRRSAADAAYVVISAAPMSALDDRSYREAQLAAGMVEGRLHLAAYALGASATGMTFLDSEVPALLGEPDDLVTLLFTCVGVPEYASRAGGRPGRPGRDPSGRGAISGRVNPGSASGPVRLPADRRPGRGLSKGTKAAVDLVQDRRLAPHHPE